MIFGKWTSAVVGPNDDVEIPRGSTKTDWEVELGVVIGTRGRYLSQDTALAHVAGYCVINDVSEREYQIERGGTWDKGKGCDTFGPTGPWLVTADEVGDPQALRVWLEVDGHRYQDSSTADMIFPVAELVAYVSQFCTLEPGDIISTGTPQASAWARSRRLSARRTGRAAGHRRAGRAAPALRRRRLRRREREARPVGTGRAKARQLTPIILIAGPFSRQPR